MIQNARLRRDGGITSYTTRYSTTSYRCLQLDHWPETNAKPSKNHASRTVQPSKPFNRRPTIPFPRRVRYEKTCACCVACTHCVDHLDRRLRPRTEVLKDKVLAKVDSLLGELDVKRKTVEQGVASQGRQEHAGQGGNPPGNAGGTTRRPDREKAERKADTDNALKRIGEYLKAKSRQGSAAKPIARSNWNPLPTNCWPPGSPGQEPDRDPAGQGHLAASCRGTQEDAGAVRPENVGPGEQDH